jgi:methyl-accepting chemotaxis protein
MAADPILPDDNHRHDPDTLTIVNLLTTRLAAVLPNEKDQRNIVKIVTKMTPDLDEGMQTFADLIHNMMREELEQEIADLKEEVEIQAEESKVTAEAVKSYSTIVNKIKRLRDLRQAADVTSGMKHALQQEDQAVSRASAELDIIDKDKLRVMLDDCHSLIKSYNDLMSQSE